MSFKDIQNAPTRGLTKENLHLGLSRRIAFDKGLSGATIEGMQQTGKSSYAMLTMWELYQHDVDEMFKHIVFSIKDLTELLQGAMNRRERLLCILWDDASVGGSASHYNTDRKLVQYLSALGDTMGIATKGLLMTSPSSDLIKSFRNYGFYKVRIGFGRHEFDRVAMGYKKGTSPYGQNWYGVEFKDTVDIRVPWYDRYYKMREELSLSTLATMDKFLNSNKDEQSKVFTKSKGGKYANINVDE